MSSSINAEWEQFSHLDWLKFHEGYQQQTPEKDPNIQWLKRCDNVIIATKIKILVSVNQDIIMIPHLKKIIQTLFYTLVVILQFLAFIYPISNNRRYTGLAKKFVQFIK